ncbi:MAG: tetratricopeptide repeat protein [Deltaproteobacteria bacterium]|nr:tetratricopeptide repeat protein [Deltaproteobacteria bacterium]MBW2171684.1 tetratricopeptide repeat protein [Deltaproteobacteria bacterium]
MSYIHEALKKAQKEKDGRHHEYQGIASTPGEKLRFFSGKAPWLASLLLVSLAFVVYLWLPSGDTEVPVIEPARPELERKTEVPVVEPARPKLTAQPKNAVILYEKARAFHKRGRLQAAKQLYKKTLSADPGHVDALNNLGVIQLQEGNYPAARTSFTEAIQLQPDYVDSHYNLACLNSLGGEASQGLVHLRKAVMVDPAVKGWARRDADLENLRGLPGFEEIVGNE